MSVEYQQASSIAVVKGVATNSQLANVVKFYTGSVTYDDEPSSKYATVTVSGKTQRVMLCIAVSGTVAYDDSPCLYSTVSGHRCLNITEPTATETPDDIPNAITTLTISGKNYPAIRCILINKTPTYDGVSSTCTFTDDDGKIHTAQLVNQVGSGSIEKIVKGVPPLTLDNAIADSLQYVKAFGGTEQRNLPDGYIQRQFIYMMDGSYLLTDLVPTYDCKIEMDFQTTNVPTNAFGGVVGGRTATYGGLQFITNYTDKKFILDAFGSSSADRYNSGVVAQDNTRYKFTFDNKVATLESGGSVLFTNTFTGTGSTGAALCINAVNDNGTPANNSMGIYLYSFKMWDNQGNLIADYVPAIQKGTVPVVGFYDTVSGTFKTATAGTFAAGGEAVPTPDAPMDIVSNNGVLKARHASGLPLGYTLLDSVIFDSTQVIDTGFVPDNNSRIESKCYRTGADCWFYGASPTMPRVTLYHSSTGINRWGNQSRNNFGFVADTEYTFVQDKNGIVSNGVLFPWNSGTAGDFICDRSLTIGNNNGSTGTRYFAGNLYYMKIYDNGVLARDFVPCKNASNVVGLYDTVNGVFYTDTGLVAGNTVSDPVEIYADGVVETIGIRKSLASGYTELEYIESTGTQYIDTGITNENCNTYGVETAYKYTVSSNNSLCGNFEQANTGKASFGQIYYHSSNTTQVFSGIGNVGKCSSTAYVNEDYTDAFTIDAVNGTITRNFNGTQLSENGLDFSTRSSRTAFLFACNSNNGMYQPTKGQIKYFKMYKDGVLVRDFVPAKRNSDGVIGMYDTVSGQFFTNAGTGDFVAGGVVYHSTATAEMLLSLGDYTDEQEIISGVVTRKLGVKVLDGTEDWELQNASRSVFVIKTLFPADFASNPDNNIGLCTHFTVVARSTTVSSVLEDGQMGWNTNGYLVMRHLASLAEVANFKQYLANQYAAGTPVIIVYPLATETTDTVTGQPMNTTAGDNILEITQASLDGLEVEVKYEQ